MTFPLQSLRSVAGVESNTVLALRVGVTRRSLTRQQSTGLSALTADRYAVACGFHPSEVWPGWFVDGGTDEGGA